MQACFGAPIYITISSTLLRREVIPSEQQQLGQKSTKKTKQQIIRRVNSEFIMPMYQHIIAKGIRTPIQTNQHIIASIMSMFKSIITVYVELQ